MDDQAKIQQANHHPPNSLRHQTVKTVLGVFYSENAAVQFRLKSQPHKKTAYMYMEELYEDSCFCRHETDQELTIVISYNDIISVLPKYN